MAISMFLEDLFRRFHEASDFKDCTPAEMAAAGARGEAVLAVLQEHDLDDADRAWLRAALAEGGPRGWLATEILWRKRAFTEDLFDPMLRAGIEEKDPSINRVYVEPLVERFGTLRVVTALLQAFEHGSPQVKTGVAAALYWATPGVPRTTPASSGPWARTLRRCIGRSSASRS